MRVNVNESDKIRMSKSMMKQGNISRTFNREYL